jgi:3-oxo-5-alpha-steroid 4-dehydrogenase 1
MSELAIFNVLVIFWFALAAAVFVALFFVAAPYGRYLRSGWGPTIATRTGWIVMEAGAVVVFAGSFFFGENVDTVTAFVFLALWEGHYIHRAFIYPFSLRDSSGRGAGDHGGRGVESNGAGYYEGSRSLLRGARRMPLAIVVFGLLFNVMNGYLNGRYIFTFSEGYANEWMADPRFAAGIALFIAGFILNRQADGTLRRLREIGGPDYKIPYGGLYRWISCPNYLGEIVIWAGWAIATWSLPGLAFAVWTAANLIPRARSNHRWYREQFADYPPERKALIPGIW